MPADPSNGDRMYRRLHVAPDASAEQIGRAYRRLAHSFHPDAHPEDPDAATRFREITEAYEILRDPARRARYDRNRQPPPTGDLRPPRAAADPNGTAGAPAHGTGRTDSRPVVIRLGALRAGSAPLTAGPVHITSSSTPHGAAVRAPNSGDLASLIDAFLSAWRWW